MWKRDLGKEIETGGFRYSWRKMEAATQDRAGWRQVVCDPPGVTILMSRKSTWTLPDVRQ